ncbi:hypothetical protein [Pedobacter sp. MW01-1-1]|uniref:hypothetical protein n=1 Tax=Pedobacter sp. MW01-1-1 TaxID=3383027 RepID=UPI003FF05B53
MKTVVAFILFSISLSCFGQESKNLNLKKDMTYDSANKLYYKITQDQDFLYFEVVKDEMATKVLSQGGIRLFFNLEGKKDTLGVPTIQFPVYTKGKVQDKRFDKLILKSFTGIPETEMPKYNEYGVTAEAEYIQNYNQDSNSNKKDLFKSKLSIPLKYFDKSTKKIAIQILLKGFRTVALPPGSVSPVQVSTSTASKEVTDMFLDSDTWTHSWIMYDIK